MAIAVSQAFLDAVDDVHKIIVVEEIRYRRRIKNTFIHEAEQTLIEDNEYVSVSPIVTKFDVQKQDTILSSNLTLTLLNKDFQWVEQNNTDGIFRPSAAEPLGYDPYKTEFEIKFGVVISEDVDAAPETVLVFTGRAVDYVFDTKSGNVQVLLRGPETKLEGVDAQKINTAFANSPATPSTGDGSNPSFTLAKSLFVVSKIRSALTERTQGLEFKLDKLNDADFPVELEFEPAAIPGLGDAVDFTALQWKLDISVSEYLGLVADAAGILVGQRNIQEPNYPAVTQFIDHGTEAEWIADTKVGTNARSFPGKIAAGNNFDNPSFVTDLTGWQVTTALGAILVHDAEDLDGTGGSARMRIGGTDGDSISIFIQVQNATPTVPQFQTGTFKNIVSSQVEVVEDFIDIPATPIVGARIHFILSNDTTGQHAILTSNLPAERAHRIYFKTKRTSLITIFPNVIVEIKIDGIDGLTDAAEGTVLTTELNLGSVPTAMSELLALATLNGGAVGLKTQSSVLTGGPFSALESVDGANIPVSPLRQFWKIEATLSPSGDEGPVLDILRLQFLSDVLTIGQAEVVGKNGLQVFQRLAEITGSEFGFTPGNILFFKPRTVAATPILNLTQDDYIVDIIPARPGYRDVKNIIQVEYGPYSEEINSTTIGESSPTSQERFDDQILRVKVNDFAFSNNADFSSAIGELLFNLRSKPKRRARVICRFIPHLTLSDVIQIDYSDSELTDPVFGDKLNFNPAFGPSGNVLYRDFICKIIGVEQDLRNARTILDVEEVL